MAAPASFPRQLLERSAEDRLAYFGNHTVAHAVLREVDEAVMQAIEQPSGASLIFVIGPTGVGKTTLLLHIQKRLIEASRQDRQEDKSHIPVASTEAVAPDTGNFNWKEYYQRALIAVSEPLIGNKVDYVTRSARKNRNGHPIFSAKPATSELRLALKDALRHRRLRAFIVDEAQHLTKMASGRKLQDQLDCVKSLANMAGTVHVLVGTYELLAFRNLSGQLSRRSADIHFRRYRADSAADVRAFQSVLWDFQRHLPLPQEPELLQHWQYCYERTIGCVGVLKTWLMQSLAEVLQAGAPSLTLQCLEKHALSVSRCVSMSTETLQGEEALCDKEKSREKLRDLLGIRIPVPVSAESEMRQSCSPKPVHHRVAQRKPHRDPVGMNPHAAQ
jgi:hypothetical protein